MEASHDGQVSPSAQLSVPEEVALAVRAEAYRTLRRPGEVLTDWLRRTFPRYVADRLAEDLLHPAGGLLFDVAADAEAAPGCPEADPRPAISKCQVAPMLPPGDPNEGPDCGTT